MIFSLNEMVFLNSIASGDCVFGFPLSFSGIDLSQEINIAKNSLIEKGILENRDEISASGVIPIKLLEIYKASQEYLVINKNLCIGRSSDHQLISLSENSEEYSLMVTTPELLSFYFLKTFEFLRGTQEEIEENIIKELSPEQWSGRLNTIKIKNFLVLDYYEKNINTNKTAFYWTESSGYKYDESLQTEFQLTAQKMRRELFERLLYFQKGEKNEQ